jgi:hypothetical protein
MSKLVNGLIPPHEPCPYTDRCPLVPTVCKHKGVDHVTFFSCASARGYEIIERQA